MPDDPRLTPEYRSARDKLIRYGFARDRTTEKEFRTVTLTDDEALALLMVLQEFAP